jgi:hypothetical protein
MLLFLPHFLVVNWEEGMQKVDDVLRLLFPTFRNVLEMVQHGKPKRQRLPICCTAVENSIFGFVGIEA